MKICSDFDQGIITDHQNWNWFWKFPYGVIVMNPNKDTYHTFIKML